MMNLIKSLPLFLIFLILLGCEETTIHHHDDGSDILYEKGKLIYNEERFTGILLYEWYPLNRGLLNRGVKVLCKTRYENGLKNGLSKSYEGNHLVHEYSYKNGKLNGDSISYYYNGQIRVKVPLIDGKKEGEWIEYHENDQLKSKGIYKNGKKEGEWVYYKEDGEIDRKEIYRDGIEIN
jgi:antitoxin component YwqK of YwqJK toxin-antitoxin module